MNGFAAIPPASQGRIGDRCASAEVLAGSPFDYSVAPVAFICQLVDKQGGETTAERSRLARLEKSAADEILAGPGRRRPGCLSLSRAVGALTRLRQQIFLGEPAGRSVGQAWPFDATIGATALGRRLRKRHPMDPGPILPSTIRDGNRSLT